jgi:hypothetical protein
MVIGGYFSGGKEAGGVKLATYLHLVPRSRMVEPYLISPILLGVAVNYLSIRKTLPFYLYD